MSGSMTSAPGPVIANQHATDARPWPHGACRSAPVGWPRPRRNAWRPPGREPWFRAVRWPSPRVPGHWRQMKPLTVFPSTEAACSIRRLAASLIRRLTRSRPVFVRVMTEIHSHTNIMYVILVPCGHPLLAWDDRRGWPPQNPQRPLPGVSFPFGLRLVGLGLRPGAFLNTALVAFSRQNIYSPTVEFSIFDMRSRGTPTDYAEW